MPITKEFFETIDDRMKSYFAMYLQEWLTSMSGQVSEKYFRWSNSSIVEITG
jgi:hypothetical protein